MKTLWSEDARSAIQRRLAALEPGARGRWGRMTATQAVAHLADACRMAIGELPCAAKGTPLRYPVVKQLIVYWLPWPKGAPTAPELVGRVPTSWGSEMTDLKVLIDRFGQLRPGRNWPEHPTFGRLTARAWGVLMYRHLDHHLRQFGA